MWENWGLAARERARGYQPAAESPRPLWDWREVEWEGRVGGRGEVGGRRGEGQRVARRRKGGRERDTNALGEDDGGGVPIVKSGSRQR